MTYQVRFRKNGGDWQALSQTYETYCRAATIATALENRGFTTEIVEVVP